MGEDEIRPASPYLSAAIEIAHQLARAALVVAPSVTWAGDTMIGDEADHRIVHAPVGSDLYGGAAGIAWFLGHIAPFDSSGLSADLAERAMTAALEAASQDMNAGTVSLLSGATGTVMAALDIADRLDLGHLRQAALEIAGMSCELIAREPVDEVDLISGSAGIIVGLLALHRRCGDPRLVEACQVIAGRLLAGARQAWWGTAWPEHEGRPALCGLAHGMSGVGWALVEMGWATGEQRYNAAARGAFHYERGWFSPERCAWPDLRDPNDTAIAEGSWPGWMTAWCHGAIGIGAVRLRLYEVEREMTALAEASAAIQAARRQVGEAGAALKAGHASDVTLCHGLGGAAELLLLAYEVLGGSDHLRAARQIGRLILDIYAGNGRVWTNGLRGADDVPGLFLGLAGIGTTLLRLHAPSSVASPLLPGRLPVGAPIATGS